MAERIIRSGKAQIHDINISYYIKKATEPEEKVIIFIHGFPFNKNSWKYQLESLEDNITGIAIDVRGHGLSTSGHGFFSIDVFAKDLEAFMEKLELQNVVLCGVSMGGYIALRAYELFPEKIAGLILSDTHHRADDNAGKQKRFDSIQAILRYGRRPFAIAFIDNLFTKKTIQENEEVIDLIKSSIRRNSVRNICATQLALASRTDSTELLSKITVPTLIIRGEQDKITPKALMEELHQGTKNSVFVEIPNTGHLPNLEDPLAFNREINGFLLERLGTGNMKRHYNFI
ncbi:MULTISPECIES: alpha/beta fold hydrolase [Sphingobacterium]|uniref:Alpha/beta hydrolase n=1 Tax=Sphingobacterium litopenaei TaxID=2763500 RepID=A0ABR7YF76_9SPHI|nr:MULTISPECIES: alpha/beta hydrolase [Sphingobacterium]MBD1429972.1 alpha/beta hydrolase [Sphingobacterium litopenaei]NGM72316.1 alpha/beta hydrolase [Sphingobacterium sp. SGL-16]